MPRLPAAILAAAAPKAETESTFATAVRIETRATRPVGRPKGVKDSKPRRKAAGHALRHKEDHIDPDWDHLGGLTDGWLFH
jgi:hypothetical protein